MVETAPEITVSVEQARSEAVVDTSNLASGVNAPGVGELSAPMQERPQWVPEKFFKDGVVNYRDMAKSLGELETKLGTAGETKSADGVVKPAAVVVAPVVAPVVPTIPGVAADRVAAFSAEMASNGKLNDASYTELAALGYPKAVVDVYVAGLTRDAAIAEAVNDSKISQTEIASITKDIGGEAVLTNMLNWAKTNLSAADQKVYNDATTSNDPAKVRMAVNGLHNAFTQLHGKDPQYIDQGGGFRPVGNGVVAYTSDDDVVADMASREYKTSPAFREKVAQRLKVSDVFKQSQDFSKVQR
jgi:capsid assembly protein